jgi:phage terminase large subunit
MRETEDSITHQLVKKFGFRTDKLTRPLIIAELVTLMREHIEIINDYDTLEEMTTFVKDERGRPQAMQGCHDDCVMATAITYYIRDQQRYTVAENSVQARPKLNDQLKPKPKVSY